MSKKKDLSPEQAAFAEELARRCGAIRVPWQLDTEIAPGVYRSESGVGFPESVAREDSAILDTFVRILDERKWSLTEIFLAARRFLPTEASGMATKQAVQKRLERIAARADTSS